MTEPWPGLSPASLTEWLAAHGGSNSWPGSIINWGDAPPKEPRGTQNLASGLGRWGEGDWTHMGCGASYEVQSPHL